MRPPDMQGWLKMPGWAWQGSTKHKESIHARYI